MIKTKFKNGAFGLAAGLALIIAPGPVLASNGNSDAGDKVTICHATGSQSNPYVRITPNANGVVNGHESHQDGRDIIPPFDYNDHGTAKHFPGQNWDANGQAIFNSGCKVPGGIGGGPQKDCDNDYDNSPASDCTTTQPQTDCDGDTDSSPASECTTGGLGGGPTGGTTTTATGQVLGASTTAGGLGAGPQVALVPAGSVNGGGGAGSRTSNPASLVGLMGSLIGVGSGLSLLNRRQS